MPRSRISEWMGPSRPTMQELAMEYVLLGIDIDQENLVNQKHRHDQRWDILQHMQGRCGAENTAIHIMHATETLKMVSPPQ